MKSVNEEDLKDVAQWLNTEIENVEITYQKESIKLYENAAKEMYDSYDEFPKDKKRTDKIIFFILHCLYYLTFTTYSLPVQSRTPILLIRTTTFPGKFLLPWDVGKQSFSIALPSIRAQWQCPQE